MEDLYLAIASAASGALFLLLSQYVIESLKHRNSVSKTVQDKLHYDRAEAIRETIASIRKLSYQTREFNLHPDSTEFFGELDAAYKEAREFVENRRIYFDLHTQKVIEDFFDLAIEALSGTHIYEKGVTRNLAKFDVKRDEINDLVMKKLPESVKALESEFAIIMGVKQKKEPEINSG